MKIPNAALRERYQLLEEREELSLAEVASRAGWETVDKRTKRKKPDSSRVARTLGLAAEAGGVRQHISEDNAVLLCRALHIDPWEIGL